MEFALQDLVDYLLAAAGNIPLDKSGIYLISEEDGDLVEKFWTGAEIGEKNFIASEIRKNSPALYILNETERCVYCVDQQNVLHCYKYDVEEGEWEDVDLQPSEDAEPLIVHASGHISGATISTGQIVFFEDANCQIRGVQVDGEGKWSYLSQDSISFKPGSPHALIHSDDGNLHLLYIHEDNSLHRLSGTPENGDWLDTAVPNTCFEEADVTNFLVVPRDDFSLHMCFLLSTGLLVCVDKNGERTDMGKVTQGKFQAQSSEECVNETMSLISKGIKSVGGGKRGK